LIAVEDIEAAWIKVLAQLRTRILAVPDRLAPEVHAAGSLADTRKLLGKSLRAALEDLANSDVQPERNAAPDDIGLIDPEPDSETGAGSAAPATGTDDQ